MLEAGHQFCNMYNLTHYQNRLYIFIYRGCVVLQIVYYNHIADSDDILLLIILDPLMLDSM